MQPDKGPPTSPYSRVHLTDADRLPASRTEYDWQTQRLNSFWRAAFAFFVMVSASSAATPPEIRELSLRGLQIGGATRLVVRGSGFDSTLQVILPVTPAPHVVCESVTAEEAHLRIDLDESTPVDFYPLRVATAAGASKAFAIALDKLPQLDFREQLAALPVAMHGTLTGDQVLRTEFVGQKGARVVIDVQAQRLGSRLRPVVRLISPSNRHLGTAQSTRKHGGDARLMAVLPEDGIYHVELQDIVFQGAAPGWFRLLIGDLRVIDYVTPLAVPSGTSTKVTLLGDPVEQATVVLTSALPAYASGQSVCSCSDDSSKVPLVGAAPWVHYYSDGDDHRSRLPFITSSIAVDGELNSVGEVDTIDVRPLGHQKLHVEVFAQRWGSPLDAVLQIVNAKGDVIAQSDDQPDTTDPGLELDVAALQQELLQIRVSSLVPVSGREYAYHLRIAPQTARVPGFSVANDHFVLPAGGPLVLPVQIADGPTAEVHTFRLPAVLQNAIRMTAADVTPDDEVGLLAMESAPLARGIYDLQLLANSQNASSSRPISLVSNGFPGTQYRPAWRESLTIAVTDPAALRVSWRQAELPRYLPRGSALMLPLHVEGAAECKGAIRLSLMTTQREPKKTVDNKEVTDLDRALRLEPDTTTIGDESTQNKDVQLIVPLDVPLHAWALAIKAELLADDGQTPIATAYTSVERLPMIEPLRLAVEVGQRQQVPVGDDGGWQVRGKVERHADFRQPVTVRFVGLADTDPQPRVAVSPDTNEFELELKFPADTTAREIANVQIEAVIEPAPAEANRQPAVKVRTQPFTLELTAATP